MIDAARHFQPLSVLKRNLDAMASVKLNVFHWHLTDDNGWRIDIKKYPELSKKSAWSVDRTDEPWKKQSPILPGEKASYGGYYTQDEIKEVAREYGFTVGNFERRPIEGLVEYHAEIAKMS